MEERFNPDMTYRFVVFFNVGDNELIDECGPEQVVVKSFTIDVPESDFDRLVCIDDQTNGAWTRFWQKTAWKFGQLGECTDPPIGLFGFDTYEIDTELQQNRLMRVWKWFLRRHGYTTGTIESITLTLEQSAAYDTGSIDIFAS